MTGQLELGGQPEQEIKKPDPDDLILWSVTTMLGVLEKPALLYWSAEQTAKAAIAMAGTLEARLHEDGEENLTKYLRDARFRKQAGVLTDAAFGTEVHRLCEQYALTGVRPDVDETVLLGDADAARACLDQFDRWLDAFQPEYLATEVAVYSERYAYAGTADAFLKIDGIPLIADYKSSKKSYGADGKPTRIYPETALQLAAYRFADLAAVWRPRIHTQFRRRYYVLGPGERDQAVPVPAVEGGLGIKITPEHVYAYPIVCDETVWKAFLFVCEVAKFQFGDSQYVIGDPLVPTNNEKGQATHADR